jgi:hypothetical protein
MAAPAYSSSQSDSSAAYDPSSTVGTAQYRGLIWLVATAFFMQARDSTIVNTAAPSIAHAAWRFGSASLTLARRGNKWGNNAGDVLL